MTTSSTHAPPELLARYGGAVPRYTSYPTAPSWRPLAPSETEAVLARAQRDEGPLSLYAHLPFCKKLCFYCGCNMMVTRSSSLVDSYLAAIEQEIATLGARFGHREVVQLHWGGGTPTFLEAAQLAHLHAAFARAFRIAPDAEQSIEIHPPVTTFEQLEVLRSCGFNRVSMGVQDFDARVQLAVNRIQPFTQTQALIDRARQLGFKSVNVDLMYGLPHQSVESFGVTLDRIGELRPDRIALFGYAHLPQLKPHQKLIPADALPVPSRRLAIFESAVERLFALGYRHIGLDHFALPSDDLPIAQEAGTLRRDFMGYTTCAESELLAFGASAISDLGGAYLQNAKEVKGYIDAISAGRGAVDRGALLSRDDLQRRAIIQALFCQRELDTQRLGGKLGVRFDDAFTPELARLATLAQDGLVELAPGRIRVTALGQVFLRNIAAVFDAYLRAPEGGRTAMSKAI
ncbi:MAG: oxygen-independent coproporphyrinogen III oxidase [Deltaproteobacteria bacterium]|nr:oxygen-independent coproporphyrinogen III oxidase [Deltaproteobacteria bacterium]